MLRLKDGVKLAMLSPQCALAAQIVHALYMAAGVSECWITSANDSTHSRGSLHYVGQALDFRVHNVPEENRTALVDGIRAALGEEFDVLFEGQGTAQAHIHVEYDPS